MNKTSLLPKFFEIRLKTNFVRLGRRENRQNIIRSL